MPYQMSRWLCCQNFSQISHDDNELSDIAIVSDTAKALYDRIREWLMDKTIASAAQMD
jgi:hypothetical protein